MTFHDARMTIDGWYSLLEGEPHEDRVGRHWVLGKDFFHQMEDSNDRVFLPPFLQWEIGQHTEYRISSDLLMEAYHALWEGQKGISQED